MNLGMNIIAVVVTYNRCALLAETLQLIESQTIKPSQIILIDNNSNDNTEQLIRSLNFSIDLYYERLDQNIGGAGGFKYGMQRAYALGADWLWCMDDDCAPNFDALEKLLLAFGNNFFTDVGFLASRVLWTDGSPCLMNLPVAHSQWIEPHGYNSMLSRIIGSSFVSILVSRKAIEAVGYPVKEFFIWFDDAEYTRRISTVMPAYLVTDSVVIHKTSRNIEPLAFSELDEANLWKYRYGIRNECSFHLHAGGMASVLIFIARIFRRMTKARLRLKFWPHIFMACFDGLCFNYPRYIEFPEGASSISVNRVNQADRCTP